MEWWGDFRSFSPKAWLEGRCTIFYLGEVFVWSLGGLADPGKCKRQDTCRKRLQKPVLSGHCPVASTLWDGQTGGKGVGGAGFPFGCGNGRHSAASTISVTITDDR